jgi:predicted transcriptional regulator
MEIQSLKLELVNKIIHTEDQSVLIKINKMLSDEISEDWWDVLPKEVQDSIMEGIKDVDEGKVYTHESVIQEAKQKYGI